MMENGSSLDENYRRIIIDGIKRRYFAFKFLGIWIMAMGGLSGLTMTKNYLFDESFKDGLFQFVPVRIFVLILSLAFIAVIIFGGYKMFFTAVKMQRAAETGDFTWTTGQLTNKKVHRRGRRSVCVLCINDIECMPMGMFRVDFNNAELGDEYIVICFEKQSLNFAFKSI